MDDYQKLLNAAFRYVSYRPRSRKEIIDFLQKKLKRYKIFAPLLLNKVIDRLTELGYVDDKKFVSWWLEQRSTYRPKGTRLLTQELKAKGIKIDISTSDELKDARRAVVKKVILWKLLPPLEKKKKIYDFLGRRGFASATIYKIIDEIVEKGYNGGEDASEEYEQ